MYIIHDFRSGPSATRPPLPSQYKVGEFKLNLNVERTMLPSCRLLVYYVRMEEVVADEVKFDVVNEFQNQVHFKINWN